jgi:hypothetical protein
MTNSITELREGQFRNYLEQGKQMKKRRILYLLVEMYMEYCGVSATYRTIAYDFGWSVFSRYAENEDTEFTGDESFCKIMSRFHPEYTDERYGDYDLLLIKEKEYPSVCMEMLEEQKYNAERCAAICYGYNCMLLNENDDLFFWDFD